MTDRIDQGAPRTPAVGTTLGSHDHAPGAGTWEIIDHADCDAAGMLRALTDGETAPLCPVCDEEVRWRLTHLAPNVAAQHPGGGHLR